MLFAKGFPLEQESAPKSQACSSDLRGTENTGVLCALLIPFKTARNPSLPQAAPHPPCYEGEKTALSSFNQCRSKGK